MLVVKQMLGEWACTEPSLSNARTRILDKLARLGACVSWEYVGREGNRIADHLANVSIERHLAGDSSSFTLAGEDAAAILGTANRSSVRAAAISHDCFADVERKRRKPVRPDTAALRKEVHAMPASFQCTPCQIFLVDGNIACPLCPNGRASTAPGFLRHLTTQHAGEALNSHTADILRALERYFCSEESCGWYPPHRRRRLL